MSESQKPKLKTLEYHGIPICCHDNANGFDCECTPIPRRSKMSVAEQTIRKAMLMVEEMGADVRLTKAVILLQEAREWVADYIDGVSEENHYPKHFCPDCGKELK